MKLSDLEKLNSVLKDLSLLFDKSKELSLELEKILSNVGDLCISQNSENNHIDSDAEAINQQHITEEEKEDLSALTEALLRLKSQLNDVVGES
jgi:hypothetical protein